MGMFWVVIIQPVHDVDLERWYCSECKNNTVRYSICDAIKRLGRRVLVGARAMFCDAYHVFFCHINLLRFDLSFMYRRNKVKVSHELVTYWEVNFNTSLWLLWGRPATNIEPGIVLYVCNLWCLPVYHPSFNSTFKYCNFCNRSNVYELNF